MSEWVLSCIDDSPYALAVIDCGAWASQVLQRPLRLLHVLDDLAYPTSPNLTGAIGLGSYESLLSELATLDQERNRLALRHSKELLRQAKARALEQKALEPSRIGRHGNLLQTLSELEPSIRLLILGKQGQQSQGELGDQVERIVRQLKCHILICQQQFKPPQQVMLAFDGSASSINAVNKVATSPYFQGLNIHLVTVVAASQATEVDQAPLLAQAKHLRQAGLAVQTEILTGDVTTALQDYGQQQGIDLLVMGAFGHSRLRQLLLGSTTTSMIKQAQQSVMIIR